MKKNKCIRCDKAERFGRVFECVEHDNKAFHLCVECAQLLYKTADARKEGNIEKASALRENFITGIRGETAKSDLLDWLSEIHPAPK